jgi:hypothetical protein
VNARLNDRFDELIALMNEFHLFSNLSTSTLIYCSVHENEIIINLCLITKELINQIIRCQTRENLDYNFDYMLIEIILNVFLNVELSRKRYNWDRINKIKFLRMINQQISNSLVETTLELIDVYIIKLSEIIVIVIATFILKSISFVKVTLEFDDHCKNARNKTNQARRNF